MVRTKGGSCATLVFKAFPSTLEKITGSYYFPEDCGLRVPEEPKQGSAEAQQGWILATVSRVSPLYSLFAICRTEGDVSLQSGGHTCLPNGCRLAFYQSLAELDRGGLGGTEDRS